MNIMNVQRLIYKDKDLQSGMHWHGHIWTHDDTCNSHVCGGDDTLSETILPVFEVVLAQGFPVDGLSGTGPVLESHVQGESTRNIMDDMDAQPDN